MGDPEQILYSHRSFLSNFGVLLLELVHLFRTSIPIDEKKLHDNSKSYICIYYY